MAQARDRVLENLREQGALTSGAAAPVNQHKMDDRYALRRLIREGAVVALRGGTYYLDEAALAAADARTRRNTHLRLGFLAGAAVVGLLVLL